MHAVTFAHAYLLASMLGGIPNQCFKMIFWGGDQRWGCSGSVFTYYHIFPGNFALVVVDHQ